jgi:hypothetical protein
VDTERDLGLVDRLAGLYSAVVSDTLDRLGFRGNAMAPHIRPLYPHAKLAGFAATVHWVQPRRGNRSSAGKGLSLPGGKG